MLIYKEQLSTLSNGANGINRKSALNSVMFEITQSQPSTGRNKETDDDPYMDKNCYMMNS